MGVKRSVLIRKMICDLDSVHRNKLLEKKFKKLKCQYFLSILGEIPL